MYLREVEVYTDGSCRGNPGPGGWAAVMKCGGKVRKVFGEDVGPTTNIRMEMMAIIRALEALKYPSVVHLYTDCEFIVRSVPDWLEKWKANGWKSSKGRVENQDLWVRLENAKARHSLTLHHIKGHNGHPDNELADSLARAAVPL